MCFWLLMSCYILNEEMSGGGVVESSFCKSNQGMQYGAQKWRRKWVNKEVIFNCISTWTWFSWEKPDFFTWNWTHECGGILCQVYEFEMDNAKTVTFLISQSRGFQGAYENISLRSLPETGGRYGTAVLLCCGLHCVLLVSFRKGTRETITSPR